MFTQHVKVKDEHMGVALGYLGMECVQIPRQKGSRILYKEWATPCMPWVSITF